MVGDKSRGCEILQYKCNLLYLYIFFDSLCIHIYINHMKAIFQSYNLKKVYINFNGGTLA